jgi:hypothetical protein
MNGFLSVTAPFQSLSQPDQIHAQVAFRRQVVGLFYHGPDSFVSNHDAIFVLSIFGTPNPILKSEIVVGLRVLSVLEEWSYSEGISLLLFGSIRHCYL